MQETDQTKFAIGLSPFLTEEDTLESLDSFCKRNSHRIYHWYLSPPYSTWKFKEGKSLKDIRSRRKEFIAQLKVLKDNNQKIQLAINQPYFKYFSKFKWACWLGVILCILDWKLFYSKYIDIDSIVCIDSYVSTIKRFFPKTSLTCSFNSDLVSNRYKYISKFNTIVVGRQLLRNIDFLESIKKNHNLKIELLLNCACHPLCNFKCIDKQDSCYLLQKKLIRQKGVDWCVAYQSLLPSELRLYPEGLIDYYKISSRPSSLSWLEEEMDFYESKNYLYDLLPKIPLNEVWQRACSTNAISRVLLEECPNLNTVIEHKEELWKKALNTDVKPII